MENIYTHLQGQIDSRIKNVNSADQGAALKFFSLESKNFTQARIDFLRAHKESNVPDAAAAGVVFYGIMMWIKEKQPSYEGLVVCVSRVIQTLHEVELEEYRIDDFLAELNELFGYMNEEKLCGLVNDAKQHVPVVTRSLAVYKEKVIELES